jgi:hypothetical protein
MSETSSQDDVTVSKHSADIREITRREVDVLLGPCAQIVQNKALFIKKHKPYQPYPWMSSSQLQESVDHHSEEISEFVEDGGAKLGTRIEYAATNVGIFAGNLAMMEGVGDPRDDDPILAVFFETVMDLMAEAYECGVMHGADRTLSFNRTSSPGVMDEEKYSCNYSVEAKNHILDMSREKRFCPHPFLIPTYRLQLDKPGKMRPSTYFTKTRQLVDGFASNDYLGGRVRHAIGFSWDINAWLMGINTAIHIGLKEGKSILAPFWKVTQEDFDEMPKTRDMYPWCGDISNNDQRQNWQLMVEFHRRLLPDWLFDEWYKVFTEGTIVSAYVDDEGKKRYYSIDLAERDNHKRLFSGEGLTSQVNRGIHLSNQLSHSYRVEKGENIPTKAEVKEYMIERHGWTFNNGDDIADFFRDYATAQKYGQSVMSTKWIPIEEEEPGFSGIGFVVDHEGKLLGAQAKMTTLFYKPLETERRDFTSSLASLPFCSIRGKLDFFRRLNHRDDEVVAAACGLFLDVLDLGAMDDQDITRAAEQELAKAAEENSRQTAIVKILNLLGETEAHVLSWKYSYDEIALVAPDLAEELFISRPLLDYIDETWKPTSLIV